MNLAQRIGQEFKTLRDDELSTKQESLVSGTNIKTINGASVLGSGDIDLSTSLSMVGNELRYTNIDGTVQAVDMSPFMDDTTNTVVSASLSGTSIIFTREDATTFTLDVSDLYDDTNLVTSVAGRNGAVILDKSDVGLGNVDNTADSAKAVLSATKLATARTINGVSFDGTANITVADSTKLPLAGGTLTGALSGTTFTGTSFNSITGLSSTTPIVAGTAAVGTGTTAARADHVHPVQTSVTGTASNVTGTVAVANGGTGATSASAALTNLGAQATLVSGTNIKTVNSTSLLGSGDVAVQPTLVSGTNIKTINNSTILGSGNIEIGGISTGKAIAMSIVFG